jgi:hypothetical protein
MLAGCENHGHEELAAKGMSTREIEAFSESAKLPKSRNFGRHFAYCTAGNILRFRHLFLRLTQYRSGCLSK